MSKKGLSLPRACSPVPHPPDSPSVTPGCRLCRKCWNPASLGCSLGSARTAPYLSVKPKSWAGMRATKTNEDGSREAPISHLQLTPTPTRHLGSPSPPWQGCCTVRKMERRVTEFPKGRREGGTVRAASRALLDPAQAPRKGGCTFLLTMLFSQ